MVTMNTMEFKKYLELKFLEWQSNQGKRKTVKEFSEFLGVSQSSVSMWWSGERSPEGENIRKLGEKLGIEVYDVLGLPRPDEDLLYLQKVWNSLSPSARRAILEKAKRSREDN